MEMGNIENEGKLFIKRVEEVLKTDGNSTVDELIEKVDEMKELMIILAKMLKQSTQKLNKLEQEKSALECENRMVIRLMQEMEQQLNKAEENVVQYANKAQQYDELRREYKKLKHERDVSENPSLYVVHKPPTDIQVLKKEATSKQAQLLTNLSCGEINGTDSKTSSKSEKIEGTKSKTTQTQPNSNKVNLKLENGLQLFDENSFASQSLYSLSLPNDRLECSLHKLQTFLLHKEQRWHQTSGREREQRSKVCKLVKEMKILQNQLEWKNSQLSYKETELKEKTVHLNEAEKKIQQLKKYIRSNKSCSCLSFRKASA